MGFLITKDEIDAGCDTLRFDPGMTAGPYAEGETYEAAAGKPLAERGTIATPLDVAEGLKAVFDPEIPVNIYDLGLVYDIHVGETGDTRLLMTLTAPNCVASEILPGEIAEAAAAVAGVGRVGVQLTFDVPWNMEMLSEVARVELNLI